MTQVLLPPSSPKSRSAQGYRPWCLGPAPPEATRESPVSGQPSGIQGLVSALVEQRQALRAVEVHSRSVSGEG
jgi:hypothetical protein